MSKVLVLPSWYPTPARLGHGIFVKKHVLEIARTNEVSVLFFDFGESHSGEVKVQISRINDLYDEILVSLPAKTGYLSVLQNFILVGKYYRKFAFRNGKSAFDILHLHIPYHIGIFLWPWLMFSRQRLVITEHWSGYFREDGRFGKLSFITRLLLRKLFQRADAITAVSTALAEAMVEKVASGKNIRIVPNVLNCKIDPRPLLPDFEKIKKFLFLGNLNNAEKNITGILDAFAQACHERKDIRLIIAGSGSDEEMLKLYAIKCGLDSFQVEFRGFVPQNQLPALYGESVCLIINSHFETFSIAAAESVLYGVPVISTRCYGPEEFINEKNGILVDRGDVIQLKNAIVRMAGIYKEFNEIEMNGAIKRQYCINFSAKFDDILAG